MKKFSQLMIEAKGKTAVFTFGRMNPPTDGHMKLAEKVNSVAKKNSADGFIFVSQTQDKKKNPVSWDLKVSMLKKYAPKSLKISEDKKVKTPFQALELLGKTYDNVIMVVGSDRIKEFESRMGKYAADFGISSLTFESSGDRDPDAEDVSGVSGSKVRSFVVSGDRAAFQKAVSYASESDSGKIFDAVADGMGITEGFWKEMTETFMEEFLQESTDYVSVAKEVYDFVNTIEKSASKSKKLDMIKDILSSEGYTKSEMDKILKNIKL